METVTTPLPSSKSIGSQNPNTCSASPLRSPLPTPLRLWRPAAQRNVRNQWSKLLLSKDRWASTLSEGRLHATALVNAHLNQRYMPSMDLGALKDMPSIRQKASEKLIRKQELYRNYLLLSYKNMVLAVAELVKSANSMRCFLKGPIASPLTQFGSNPEHEGDPGDGGGIPVFSSFSVSHFENLATELADMFVSELGLKRFLAVELLSIRNEEVEAHTDKFKWSDELYTGEFQDLTICGMCSEGNIAPVLPRISGWQPCRPSSTKADYILSSDTLQVYLTTWISDVNIDLNRVNDIFNIVEEETQIKLT